MCLPALEPDEQQAALRRAYGVFRPSGVYITGSVIKPPTAEEERHQFARWKASLQDAGLNPAEVEQHRAIWDEARAQIPTPDRLREMLTKAGFT